jgi:NADH-quinone oxidoreductase subunit G
VGTSSAAGTVGRDTSAIIAAASSGDSAGCWSAVSTRPTCVGSGDLLDALTRSFVVSLEIRESAVTESADVVLPGRPPTRRRPAPS